MGNQNDSVIIDVFNYFNYREYLRDYFAACKKSDPRLTHRSFLRKAVIPGSAHLQRIIAGTRNLTAKYFKNYASALGLDEKQAAYFKTLIRFEDEKHADKKERYLRTLLSLRTMKPEFLLENEKLTYYKKWYYSVVRNLLAFVDFKDDYRYLAGLVVPRILPEQAREAVSFLERHGFVIKKGSGRYELSDSLVTTGPEVNSTIVRRYHKKVMGHAKESIDRFAQDNRDVSFLTLSVSDSVYRQMKNEIQEFRKRLLRYAKPARTNPETGYAYAKGTIFFHRDFGRDVPYRICPCSCLLFTDSALPGTGIDIFRGPHHTGADGR